MFCFTREAHKEMGNVFSVRVIFPLIVILRLAELQIRGGIEDTCNSKITFLTSQ